VRVLGPVRPFPPFRPCCSSAPPGSPHTTRISFGPPCFFFSPELYFFPTSFFGRVFPNFKACFLSFFFSSNASFSSVFSFFTFEIGAHVTPVLPVCLPLYFLPLHPSSRPIVVWFANFWLARIGGPLSSRSQPGGGGPSLFFNFPYLGQGCNHLWFNVWEMVKLVFPLTHHFFLAWSPPLLVMSSTWTILSCSTTAVLPSFSSRDFFIFFSFPLSLL